MILRKKYPLCQVTINYRLSGLGWLSLDREEVQGNQGLHDMVAALAWIQNNVGNFGGDPGQVTIFGESAGSWGVSYLSVSPLAKVGITLSLPTIFTSS